MRNLGRSLLMVLVLGCGARPAATVMSGDVPSGGGCSIEVACNGGGGASGGALLMPLAIAGATALGVAGIAYVYHLVWPDLRVSTSPPP